LMLQHAAEVEGVITVLAGGYIHSGGSAITEEAKTVEIVGRNRFFKPDDVEIAKAFGEIERLLAGVSAVGVDEEANVWADSIAGDLSAMEVLIGMRSDFHFDGAHAFLRPTGELVTELIIVIGGKAAAAIGFDLFARGAEKIEYGGAQ